MEMIVASWPSPEPGIPTPLVALVDEMQEDPHCLASLLGRDDTGALLVTVWDGDIAVEVAAALAEDYPGMTVRLLALGSDAVMLG
ncbi:MAG: hypothetical protein ACE5GC_06500 [Acidimicrobiia bacterium]